MTSVTDSMSKLTGWLNSATELGMAIVLTAVIIDVLFPGSTKLVANLGTIVAQFTQEGLAGLIALLLFLIVFKQNK